MSSKSPAIKSVLDILDVWFCYWKLNFYKSGLPIQERPYFIILLSASFKQNQEVAVQTIVDEPEPEVHKTISVSEFERCLDDELSTQFFFSNSVFQMMTTLMKKVIVIIEQDIYVQNFVEIFSKVALTKTKKLFPNNSQKRLPMIFINKF